VTRRTYIPTELRNKEVAVAYYDTLMNVKDFDAAMRHVGPRYLGGPAPDA
jgi:hypothetical protein